uniref:E2 ubiquitin-conjugating enzyme n=1 Tax=Ciona intestinalis TaxID=7719 RepID=F6UXG6_CIOIN|nr:ubiquitin-conjugating enzyme E2 S [Ciona intestinalis]|eukprot:XP_002131307.1 ubiquitin-conjugating enzyme E2 S [Ciona intestinalis]
MALHGNQENLSPHIVRQVYKEFTSLKNEPVEGIQVTINEDDVSEIHAVIEGPQGTPFAGGIFKMKLCLTRDFPASPPKGFFLTKIFHPNVSSSGEICVNTLKQDWNSKMGIRNVLLTIKCLLIHPNPESALNEEAGRLLLEHYADYEERAKLMTEIHALPSGSRAQRTEEKPSTSGLGHRHMESGGNGPASKKHAAEKLNEKKRKEKKRGLKRL